MQGSDTRTNEVRQLLIENLMLQKTPAEIPDDLPLFGPGGLGLDSVDALQIVVALDKNYGLKIPDPDTARTVLGSVNSIAAALEEHLARQATAGGAAA